MMMMVMAAVDNIVLYHLFPLALAPMVATQAGTAMAVLAHTALADTEIEVEAELVVAAAAVLVEVAEVVAA